MSRIIKHEYPETWPDLLTYALDKMQKASKTKELYASLCVVKYIIQTYEMMLGSKRNPLRIILARIFPFLENLAGNQLKNWTPDSIMIMEVVLECFRAATEVRCS